MSRTPLLDKLAGRAARRHTARARADEALRTDEWAERPVRLERTVAHFGAPEALFPGDTLRVVVHAGAVEDPYVVVAREQEGRVELLTGEPWVPLDALPREGDGFVLEIVTGGSPGLQRYLVGVCEGSPTGVERWEDAEMLIPPGGSITLTVRMREP